LKYKSLTFRSGLSLNPFALAIVSPSAFRLSPGKTDNPTPSILTSLPIAAEILGVIISLSRSEGSSILAAINSIKYPTTTIPKSEIANILSFFMANFLKAK